MNDERLYFRGGEYCWREKTRARILGAGLVMARADHTTDANASTCKTIFMRAVLKINNGDVPLCRQHE
jgi:hypothetical protein